MLRKVETLNSTVDKELAALPGDMQAEFMRIGQLIDDFGVGQTNAPYIKYIKHVTKKLWEIRINGRNGTARAFYTIAEQQILIVRVFIKKTRRTPQQEIQLALQRIKEI